MESDFSVSFINVGSADCTLIKCGDKSVLIDGGTNLVTDKITAYRALLFGYKIKYSYRLKSISKEIGFFYLAKSD